MITPIVEVEFSAGVWTDITADCRESLSGQYGINGGGPADRVASTGTFRFLLDNSAANSAGLTGYYSPGHADCRTGFDLGLAVRVRWTDGVDTVGRGIGAIATIAPQPGKYLEKRTLVECTDWVDQAASADVVGVETQLAQRADQILTTLLAAFTGDPPAATDFDTCDSTFTYALDNVESAARLWALVVDLVASEGSYAYILGDGTLRLEKRTARGTAAAPVATLDETMHGLTVGRAKSDIINRVRATAHPRRIDASATTVLYSLDSAPQIDAGGTLRILSAYGDPANGNKKCGGMNMVTPVATTDYAMNTAADGSGADLTAVLSVTANFGSAGVQWVLENTGATTGYITNLQCRGKGIYDYQAIGVETFDQPSIAALGESLSAVNMPYQDDLSVAQGYAEYLLALYATPISRATSVTFITGDGGTLDDAAMDVDVGDLIALSETVTGVDAQFYVQAISYRYTPVSLLEVTWTLAPALSQFFWTLGLVGSSELDTTARWGYA